jgi:hypothetical protein
MAFYVFVGTGRDLSLPDKSIYNILKKKSHYLLVYCTLHRFEQNRNLIKIFYKIFRFYYLHSILKSCKITEIIVSTETR